MEQVDFLQMVEEILEVRPGTITLADNLEDIEWDSLANISFIAAVDDNLGITLDTERLADSKTTGDLLALVQEASKAA